MKELVTFTDSGAFLQVVQQGLETREAENSLMLGLLINMQSTPPAGQVSPLFISIQDHGAWSLAAVMAAPNPLVLATASTRTSTADLSLLGQHFHQNGIAISGVVAPRGLAKAFASRWKEISGCRIVGVMRQRTYCLTAVADIPDSPGRLRPAIPADLALVSRWLAEFSVEALGEDVSDRARQMAERRIQRREVYLWEDSEPRSMAARSRPTRNTVSVNAVYTPPVWRRQGLATAAVARLSQELLAEGYAMCVLYTDLSNLTSNRIYQRIGYRPVGDSEHIRFESPGRSIEAQA